MALRLASDTFETRLGALLEKYRYDIVQIEGIEMAPYGLWLANHPLWRSARVKENLPGIPIGRPALVFDDHNAEYVLQQRALGDRRASPCPLARGRLFRHPGQQAATLRAADLPAGRPGHRGLRS